MEKGLEIKYFVLKPEAKNLYDMYARASQDAMIAYSERIRTENPTFILLGKLGKREAE